MGIPGRLIVAVLAALGFAHPAQGAGATRPVLDDQGFTGVLGTHSSLSLVPGEVAIGLSGQGRSGADHLTIRGIRPDEGSFLDTRFSLGAGFGHGIDGGLALPYYFESFSGDSTGFHRSRGHGDLTLGLKAVLPWGVPGMSFSVMASGTLPIASGEGSYPRELEHHPSEGVMPSPSTWPLGTVDPRLRLGIGASFSLSGILDDTLRLHLNLHAARPLSPPDMPAFAVAGGSLALEIPLGIPASVQLAMDRQILLPEVSDWTGDAGESMTWTLAASWTPTPWASARMGGRFAPDAYNRTLPFAREGEAWTYRPQYGASLYMGASLQGFPLRWDRDRDGLPDRKDRCPRRAEDLDGFEDADGCPEIDNDRDGFTDSLDRCPNAVEDRDGFKDWDGCPDADNDKDGVPDAGDVCPNDPEDPDGLTDADGCPDLDDDRDGIPDAADRCPRSAENRNGIEDADGCPEADTDRDGRPDKLDRCPEEAEIVNFFQDEDGCPDQKPEPVRNGILPGVAFLTGNAELQPGSYRSLDSLAALLETYPGTEIEIQGHLDDRSGTGAMELSMERARAVAAYLERKGVEPRRMKPAGYGASRPIAPNRTASGREANRRIEIRRLN